jgi:hypothetical protein
VKVKSLSKSEMEGKRRENGNYLTEKRAIATDETRIKEGKSFTRGGKRGGAPTKKRRGILTAKH